jgi:hypothetical protein
MRRQLPLFAAFHKQYDGNTSKRLMPWKAFNAKDVRAGSRASEWELRARQSG